MVVGYAWEVSKDRPKHLTARLESTEGRVTFEGRWQSQVEAVVQQVPGGPTKRAQAAGPAPDSEV